MNDFTKEELINLHDILEQSDEINYLLIEKLLNKIQFMIDNYQTNDCQQSIDD